MAVRIVTDSTCDLSAEEVKRLGVDIIPLKVLFGETEYIDGVDLTAPQFYKMLAQQQELPKTSQVPPQTFLQLCAQCLRAEDEVVILTISSTLSGTYQSALMAKEQLGSDKIHVVDSRQVTASLAILVRYAARLRDEGRSAEQIAAALERKREKARLYAVVDTLKYLRMGGRLSATVAVAGSVLGIKPILSVKDGSLAMEGKARGFATACERVSHIFLADDVDRRMPMCFVHSDAPDKARMLQKLCREEIKGREELTVEVGPVVGTHAGPGCAGVAYFVK